MESRNLDKALDIVSGLLMGENISEKGSNASLYQEYSNNGEVYDIVQKSLKKMNMKIYEYNNSLYVSAGENNRVFGYSNEELRREIGIRSNRELYLAYFVMYNVLTYFYQSSDSSAYAEFVKIEEIISAVDASLSGVLDNRMGIILEDVEENSFKQIALSWDELPAATVEDAAETRAARNSKAGFVKLVLSFMMRQDLLTEVQGRFYPKDRFRALSENYFEEYKGRLLEVMRGADYATD